MKKVLVLAAHPDDETLGCGGTINRLSSEGYEIELLTFTNGVGSRGDDGNRNEVLDLVQANLGLSKYTYGDFPDNAMDSVPLLQLCKFIEKNTSDNYDIIFTHFIGDLNVDHQKVAAANLTVFRPQQGKNHKIYSYYVPSSTDYNAFANFNGDTYFKLSDSDVDMKTNTLRIYDDEMRTYPHSRSYENIKNLMKVWGSEIGTKYAEKFKMIRCVI